MANLRRGYHERDLVRALDVVGRQLYERAVRRFVMIDYGVDAGDVTAPGQRTRIRVFRATGPVVFLELLDFEPPVLAVVAVATARTGRYAAAADATLATGAPVLVVVAVFALQLHGRHQPVKRRVRADREPETASAPGQVLGARRTAHVRFQAQPVRRQRLRATSVTRHQLTDLRT